MSDPVSGRATAPPGGLNASGQPQPSAPSSERPPGGGDTGAAQVEGVAGAAGGAGAAKRRRGSRGGRGRRSGGAAKGSGPEAADGAAPGGGRGTTADEAPGAGLAPAAPSRRPKIGDTRPAPAPPPEPRIGDTRPAPPSGSGDGGAVPAGEAAGGAKVGKKKRRRGGRGRSGGAREGAVEVVRGEQGSADQLEEPIEVDPETVELRRGKERNGRPLGRYLMAVHVRPHATQIAVLEGRALIEHYVSRPTDDASQIDGNIYLAKVQNVLPGMEAAFVDIGTPKNAVLYRGDVRYDPDDVEGGKGASGRLTADTRIEQLLRPGQTIVCQVTKNPIGTKGARLTQEVSLPGRFVVLIPNSDTYGISKRLGDEERRRLRRILDEVKPEHHGIIVRTAAETTTADELRRDVVRLLKQWEAIEAAAKRSKAPALLYKEPDLAVRVIREEFNKQYRGVVIDDRALYEEVREYVVSITPELADRVEFYDHDQDPLPIFERFHIHEQLHKALDRKVWLPSGGSLIIERTEALTVIDVNTGKNVGTSNLEETVFRNNLEAADEIARQLRLRDIGGIIVIDFIDMEIKPNREQVMRSFREALARDKTRTQVFDISELGLVEMTRKRVSEGLVESFSQVCPTCVGRGLVFDDTLL
ncbi:MAG: Rne/Rng family ribonuclease [Actinobacteria bacterium]|nr:Rne/Rng family ribonuclease [Actinomycetota bacterium]